MTAVMAKWLAWQIAVLSGACSRLTMNASFQSGAGHHTAQLSMNDITVPTEFIHHLYRQFGKNGWYALGMTTPP